MKKALSLLLFFVVAFAASAETGISIGRSRATTAVLHRGSAPDPRDPHPGRGGRHLRRCHVCAARRQLRVHAGETAVGQDRRHRVRAEPARRFLKMQLVQASVMGKFPIPVGTITVWPALGFSIQPACTWTTTGTGDSEVATYDSMGDFYLIGGVGVDVPIAAGILPHRGSVRRLEPDPVPRQDYTASYTWWDVKVKVGAGFKL